VNRHLVIGGGLIGSHVALELGARGGEVAVLSRSFSDLLRQSPEEGEGIRLVQAEVRQTDQLAGLLEWADSVFFLAGTSTPALSDSDATDSITALLEPALHVFDAMRESGPSRLILASSGGTVYGRASELPTDEAAQIAPISVHGVNALATEQYAALYAREHGITSTVLRFSNVYGPGQRPRGGFGVIAAWCEAAARGEPLILIGDGSVRRDFVHARDAARAAALAAAEREPAEVLNVGSGRSISLLKLIELLSEIVGHRLEVEARPPRSIDVPVTELDSSVLTALTGWRPEVELRDGLAECWEWARAHAVGSPTKL
jgi:UDP-glucose 4-epimerase